MRNTSLGRDYYRLWSAHTLSNLGGGIYFAALPLLASTVTDQPALVAGVAAAIELPWLLFGMLAGAIADRFDRRYLAIVATAGNALLVALLALAVAFDHAGLPVIYLVAFAIGSCGTLSGTATMTMTPQLVQPQQLDRANGRLIAAGSTGSELLGPALGGYLFGLAATLPFALNAGTAAVAAALLCALPSLLATATRTTADQAAKDSTTVWRDIAEGTRWLLRHRQLRSITVLSVVFALTDTAWFALMVLYVRDILGLPASAYGLLLGIGAVGGLAGGLLAARLSQAVGSTRVLLSTLLLAAAIAQAVLAFTAHTVLAAGSLAVSSFAFGVWNVVTVTSFQTLTPPELLGRVSSANRTAIMGASPIGALLGGLAANAMGIRAPFVLGLPVLVLGAGFGLLALRGNQADETTTTGPARRRPRRPPTR